MIDYLIECAHCEIDSRVISNEEPSFCPICGEDSRAIVVEMDLEEDDI